MTGDAEARRPRRRARAGDEWPAPDGTVRTREARCVTCGSLLGLELLDDGHISIELVAGLVELEERGGWPVFGMRSRARLKSKSALRTGRSGSVHWRGSDGERNTDERIHATMADSHLTVMGPAIIYCPNCSTGQELPPA